MCSPMMGVTLGMQAISGAMQAKGQYEQGKAEEQHHRKQPERIGHLGKKHRCGQVGGRQFKSVKQNPSRGAGQCQGQCTRCRHLSAQPGPGCGEE